MLKALNQDMGILHHSCLLQSLCLYIFTWEKDISKVNLHFNIIAITMEQAFSSTKEHYLWNYTIFQSVWSDHISACSMGAINRQYI